MYVAVYDLVYDLSHGSDHIYSLSEQRLAQGFACKFMAFVSGTSGWAQFAIPSFTALNVFMMIVKGRKIGLGRYDWKLTVSALSIGLVYHIAAEAADLIGPNIAW